MRDNQKRGLDIVRGVSVGPASDPDLGPKCRRNVWVGEGMTDHRILGA